MSKKRRSSGVWKVCENKDCQVQYLQSDAELHLKSCPPTEPWTHSFIQNGIYYFTIENDKTQVTDFVKRSTNPIHSVFISETISTHCQILQDDWVVIKSKYNEVIKKAILVNDEALNSVYLTKNAIELNSLKGPAQLERLKTTPLNATEIFIHPVGKSCTQDCTPDLINKISTYNENLVFTIGNRISIQKQKLVYQIMDIKTDENSDEKLHNNVSEEKQKFLTKSTKWIIVKTVEQIEDKQINSKLAGIGGYSSLLADLRGQLHFGLGKYNLKNCKMKFSKGVLLHGPPGVGKSMIAEALLSEIQAHVVKLDLSIIYSKHFKEPEQVIQGIFNEACEKTPSIIFIENIDDLCPKKNKSSSDYENKVLGILKTLIDEMYSKGKNIMVLATTSRPEAVDVSLRQAGRIDKEFEMPVPTSKVRKEILLKIIQMIPHKLSDDDLNEIAYHTHGFVGADLKKLCSEAYTKKIIQAYDNSNKPTEEVFVTKDDFNQALKTVNPSAMKGVLVDVPNVKWSDIGGQKDLKHKLLQCVDWPLKHPEVFTKMGIEPPKGILMFGPPGCSKTMIAKALATESKLNFLNVKGPELFSKYVGDSEKAVRELFQKARQVSPCIIFIDEIETLVVERSSASNSGGGSVQERVLTQLLTELDGVTALKNVLVVAATNRPDKIDKALLRPGRFDKLIYVPLPDAETRLEIFKIKVQKMPLSKDVALQDLVSATHGYSGAEIQAICQEACYKALEENMNDTLVTRKHFDIAIAESFPRTDKNSLKIYHDYIPKTHNEPPSAPRFCRWLRFWKRK